MTRALDEEVIEFNEDFEKFTEDIQFLVDEIKQEVQKTLDDFQNNQKAHTEKLDQFEKQIQNDVSAIRENFENLQQDIELFKENTLNLIENTPDSEQIGSGNLIEIQEKHSRRLDEIEKTFDEISQFKELTPEKLREELIAGIRMLGERVSKAINEINTRFETFSKKMPSVPPATGNPVEESARGSFAQIKESSLFDMTDFEIVPRDAVKKLTELFKKQTSAIKHFIEKQESRLAEFEELLKTYDEENTRLLELLDKKVKRNFRITMGAVILVIAGSILINIIF